MKDKVRVSDITSLIFCQRYCYFNLSFPEETTASKFQAMKEMYYSYRNDAQNWEKWAKNRFLAIYGKESEEIFNSALKEFKISKEVDEIESVETEVEVYKEELNLTGILDELVEGNKPLILGYKAPESGIWYRDRVKLTAFCMILDKKDGFVYYCKSGKLKGYEVTPKDRKVVIKAIDRVNKLKKGFLPEKTDKKNKCKNCKYKEICDVKDETFASKFL